MRGTFVSALAVAALLAPAVAAGQQSTGGVTGHEFGVDLSLAYLRPVPGSGYLALGTPVDLRFGFAMRSWVLEPRFSLFFQSNHVGGGIYTNDINHNFAFDLNALVPLGHASTNRKGMYVTGGGGVALSGGSATGFPIPSGALFQLNAGVGTRLPVESGALRLEAFAKYHFANSNLGYPHIFEVGARIGLSLFH